MESKESTNTKINQEDDAAMYEQVSELIKGIGSTLFEQLLAGETSAWTEVCLIEGHYEEESNAESGTGELRSFGDGMRRLSPDFKKLRIAMYNASPDQGAWYVARVTVSGNGKVTAAFDYDDRSKFHIMPDDEEFEEDLQRFPRGIR